MVPSPQMMLVGSHDYRLVALSVAIAILASYAALDVAGRVTATRGAPRAFWLAGGATAMGLGICCGQRRVENVADLPEETVRRERFLDERDIPLQCPLTDNGAVGVARGEEARSCSIHVADTSACTCGRTC